MTLFDDTIYLDADYAAALEFCRTLTLDEGGAIPERILPGAHDSNFCPIACTLATAMYDRDMPAELTKSAMDKIGGLSTLFEVGVKHVAFPAVEDIGWSVDLLNLPDAELDRYLAEGFDYDQWGGEFLRRTVALPADVQRFVKRFDLGEFPSLELANS